MRTAIEPDIGNKFDIPSGRMCETESVCTGFYLLAIDYRYTLSWTPHLSAQSQMHRPTLPNESRSTHLTRSRHTEEVGMSNIPLLPPSFTHHQPMTSGCFT